MLSPGRRVNGIEALPQECAPRAPLELVVKRLVANKENLALALLASPATNAAVRAPR
jgi:hypothetical protein